MTGPSDDVRALTGMLEAAAEIIRRATEALPAAITYGAVPPQVFETIQAQASAIAYQALRSQSTTSRCAVDK